MNEIAGRCPECRKGLTHTIIRDEEINFDTGTMFVVVYAKNVPINVCDSCHEEFYGPDAVKIRDAAIHDELARHGITLNRVTHDR